MPAQFETVTALPRERVAAAYVAACREEIAAPKPGNVHVFAEGHGMTAAEFHLSAERSAPPLTEPGAGVGRRVLGAIEATHGAVGQNTNLGIVLLCAPLAAAMELPDGALRERVAQILRSLTREDTRQVFAAIALARPGGLGRAAQHDVHGEAVAPLAEVMAQAAHRDRIARAYITEFEDVFQIGQPALERAGEAKGPPWWPATAVHLAFLSAFPDSHIARKHGEESARSVMAEAQAIERSERDLLRRLLAFDTDLKRRGLNPGTSADLTVATLFAASLEFILLEGADNG